MFLLQDGLRKIFLQIFETLIKSKYFILGGGGLFPNDNPLNGNLLLSVLLKKQVVIFGVGVNPVNNCLTRLIWNFLVNNKYVKLVTLRDIESHDNILAKNNVKNERTYRKSYAFADLAFSSKGMQSNAGSLALHLNLELEKKYCMLSLAMPWSDPITRDGRYKKRYEKFLIDMKDLIIFVGNNEMVPVFFPFYQERKYFLREKSEILKTKSCQNFTLLKEILK